MMQVLLRLVRPARAADHEAQRVFRAFADGLRRVIARN